MNVLLESAMAADAEWRRVGANGTEGRVFARLASEQGAAVELRIRLDDPSRGQALARRMRAGASVYALAHRAWPRTDHDTAAVLVGDVTALAVDGVTVPL